MFSFRRIKKTIVIWVGAGASAWCGLPLWSQLAEHFHKEYGRYESTYDRKSGNEFLSQALFPEFFSSCKQINAARFNNLLVASLKTPTNPPPVYTRFISALKATKQPLQILTTNVDEALEQNLQRPVILPTDLGRLKTLIQNRESFIAKLHGSVTTHPVNYPVVWNDANYGNKALGLWKKRSLEEFQQICNQLRLAPYDLCPCGSGEKIKFCCGASFA